MEPIDYLYCWDWALFNTKIPSIKYAKFDQANKVDKTQMLMVQYPSPNQSLYARPTYQPAIKSILLDKESDTYQLAYLKNAVNPSVVISFPFDLDEEEKAMLIDGLRDDFSDTENAGKVFTTFSKGDVLPTITQLNPLDIGKGFLDMTDNTTRKICLGHGISPLLIGVKTSGSLGNATEFPYAFNLFNQGQIQPAQQHLENIFNEMLTINGLTCTFAFNDADINQLNPVLGVTTTKPTEVAAEELELEQETIPVTVNDTLRKMSGREYQGMLRVIRQFGQGKITKEQASVMLSSGYGLTDEQITMMLTTQE
jgi:hypothetical protein